MYSAFNLRKKFYVTKSMAVDLVDECGGSVTRAMRKLGYPTRQTLHHWLNRRDASREAFDGANASLNLPQIR